MLRHIQGKDSPKIVFEFDGRRIGAAAGDTVASALLAAGEITFRSTPVSGAPRGPFCMMGVCFECLVEIDDIANRQACMTHVKDGMVVRRQRGAEGVEEQ
ncbi:(2Fe-2S)-binding protein [Agrobacterium tumefaciens]|uniref:(2Fe-2S)-binding protein n=1 Tax=Agrobacterium tumefaciens TaxID=358 RepID=UPI002244E387|nr:(2Fe-2S)-binding protein [Agrobacterium tumefaciens]MCW8143084.1 (2Fe-2S)-binding protein [Agrobacterium tumefaciens]